MAFPDQRIGVTNNPLTNNVFFSVSNIAPPSPPASAHYITTENSFLLLTEDNEPLITES